MRTSMLIPLATALLVGCATDEDKDDFNVEDDCDDTNAEIYPGAPETVGDGIDSDCDGEDPPHPFLGDWTLQSLKGVIDGEDYFEGYETNGSLKIGENLKGTTQFALSYDGETYELLSASGDVTPGSAGAFSMDLTGTWASELPATADWDCVTAAAEITCTGATNVTGDEVYSLDTTAVFKQ